VARVAAFVPDLMFGSSVHAALTAAGHDVQLLSELAPDVEADVLVVDLTADAEQRIERARAVSARGLPTLAFYSHVETDVRQLADQAGFDLVVPRSRMARESATLVTRLVSNAA
jgi:hypothetical protein